MCARERQRETDREKGRERERKRRNFLADYFCRVGLGAKQKKLHESLLFEFITLCITFLTKKLA